MQKKQPETDDIVKLKPIMGIRPGVWLFALYSVILLVILFLFLVLPGLRNPGAEIVLITEPQGAALRVDGVYMGTAKDKIFVPEGVHTLSAALPGFDYETVKVKIPGRVFGSLFFPLRINVEFNLKTSDPSGAFAESAVDFAEWSFAGEPTATWQIPLSISEGAYRTGQIIDNQTAAQILTSASRFTATRAAMRDIVRAKMLMDNKGLSPSPASAYGSVSDILAFLSENPGSANWLFGLLPAEAAAMVKASDWYKKEAASLAEQKPAQRSWTARLNLAGLSFSGVTNFMISESAVSQAAFENFLKENPAWSEIGASWFAASEFCRQLTSRLPPSMAGMEVRLPTEAEWELAAETGVIKPGEGAANGMGGWEWCADPFAPLRFIKADANAVKMVGSPERSLRSSIDSSRASLPPEYSSPNVSFRPVIAEKNSGY
jgi:gamma-glutamyl hercynylcysteine S-oxide synthase